MAAEPVLPAAPDAGAQSGLVEHYERLRAAALSGGADGWRLGLGVVAGKGVPGWIRAWTGCPGPAPAPRPVSSEGVSPTPPAQGSRRPPGPEPGQMVRVLAAMALAHA